MRVLLRRTQFAQLARNLGKANPHTLIGSHSVWVPHNLPAGFGFTEGTTKSFQKIQAQLGGGTFDS